MMRLRSTSSTIFQRYPSSWQCQLEEPQADANIPLLPGIVPSAYPCRAPSCRDNQSSEVEQSQLQPKAQSRGAAHVVSSGLHYAGLTAGSLINGWSQRGQTQELRGSCTQQAAPPIQQLEHQQTCDSQHANRPAYLVLGWRKIMLFTGPHGPKPSYMRSVIVCSICTQTLVAPPRHIGCILHLC
ncbi:hypothetical protein F2P79_009458 [Pimephales promelas]|nr:hypothetical protein F2P79_009458 [Pimephales promelas]